tara:strand:- start:166 stop:456 length:291 start_codon:yes stop_codon:yes gene_type:complete
MLFVIFCIDKPNMEDKRAEVMAAHVEYLNTQTKVKNVISGPLMDDDMKNIVGSLYLLEAQNREDIEELTTHDPLVKADIWSSVEIRAFNKRVDNRD